MKKARMLGNILKFLLLTGFNFIFAGITLGQDILLWYDFEHKTRPEFSHESIIASEVTISQWFIMYQDGADPGGTTCGNSWAWKQGLFSPSGKYLEFAISPSTGYKVELSSMSVWFGRSEYGPRRVTIHYSFDDFATDGIPVLENAEVICTGDLNLSYFFIKDLPSDTPFSKITFRIWGHSATGTGTLRFNDLRFFGDIKTDIFFPVELIDFSALWLENKVLLNWSTACEINNDYFTIERSCDAVTTEIITIVPGAGNSNEMLHYHYSDPFPLDGISYYRLKQTDFDGNYEYSNWIVADGSRETGNLKVSVFRYMRKTWLKIISYNSCPLEIIISDLFGRTLMHQTFPANQVYPATIPLGGFDHNLLIFSISDGKEKVAGKIVF